MDKIQGAVKQEEEAVSSQVDSPETETPTAPEVPETAEKPVETPEEQTEPEKLPDESDQKSEQGKAFAEMRRKIKELEAKVKEKETRQSSFDSLQQFIPQPQPTRIDPNQFVDASGNFNQVAYNVAINQANQYNADLARKQATETVEFKLDEYQARQRFPELNTNKRFERAVANEYQARLLESVGNPQGRVPTIQEIAEEYAPYFSKDAKSVVKEVTQKVKEELTEKEQAALSASGRAIPQSQTNEELERLRQRSRKGDFWAVAERMKRAK